MFNKIFNFTNSKNLSSAYLIIAVFICYTGMYAVRKSFLAGQFTGLDFGYGLDAKTILVLSQVLGYMLSKFFGIRIVSEMKKEHRVSWLTGLVSFGLLMLAVFAWGPGLVKVAALFLNGLSLGIVFGIVFSFIEGRKNTELLAAALSATFIFSTGLVKTTGLVLMQDFNLGEYQVPFLTGLLFFPLFLLSVWVLNRTGAPDDSDIRERVQRVPMYREDRRQFLIQNGTGYFGLVAIYIVLTVVRDFRDNFVVEFWAEQGFSKAPQVVTLTEIPVAVSVLLVASAGVLIRNNKTAFNVGMWLMMFSALLMLCSTMLFNWGRMNAVVWMIVSGIGVYLPYILFHCLVFERLVALLKFKGNVGFLFYMADAFGYLGSVAVLVLKEVLGFHQSWSVFFVNMNLEAASCIFLITVFVTWYFNKKFAKKSAAGVLNYT